MLILKYANDERFSHPVPVETREMLSAQHIGERGLFDRFLEILTTIWDEPGMTISWRVVSTICLLAGLCDEMIERIVVWGRHGWGRRFFLTVILKWGVAALVFLMARLLIFVLL